MSQRAKYRQAMHWPSLCLGALLLLACSHALAARTWTDKSGKFSLKADFIELVDGKVRLKNELGQMVAIPLDRLSASDQQYVREQTKPRDEPQATTVDNPFGSAATTSDAGQTTKVIAEGVGLTAKKALDDAYRNAVRQVVGAVIDADTLIKNDELVSDKVLTYSDGFVKKYDELNKETDDGLVRVRILAHVERRSVVARLQAANVTIREVDGESLFAAAVTDAEAEKNATAIVRKHLSELPKLLTIVAAGKPDYDRKTSEIVLGVTISADFAAFDTFAKRFTPVLEKICREKTQVLVKGEMDDGPSSYDHGWFAPEAQIALPKRDIGQWLWVNTFRNGAHDTTRYEGFLLDVEREELRKALAGQTVARVTFLDSAGELVTEDRFLVRNVTNEHDHYGERLLAGLDRETIKSMKKPSLTNKNLAALYQLRYAGYADVRSGRNAEYEWVITPFVTSQTTAGFLVQNWCPRLTVPRRVSATLDEVARIKKIKCEIIYTPLEN